MAAPWLGGRQTPHDQFNEGVLRKKAAFVQEQLGFHVGHNNNSSGYCQREEKWSRIVKKSGTLLR
jgi:hypothetical protein